MKQLNLPSKQGGWITAALGIASVAGSLLGASKSAKASKNAAKTQAASADKAIGVQERANAQARADLSPFAQAGRQNLPKLQALADDTTDLVTNPDRQASFIKENPFFGALAKDAETRLLKNQAARGKVGSGGTAEALQNSILLLGNNLLNQDVNRRNVAYNEQAGITQLGQSAAAGQASSTLNTGAQISNLTTSQGNVNAAGKVGAANAWTQGINSAISGATGAYDIYSQNQNAKIAAGKVQV